MFYPAKGHGIEDEYIEPVLKNLKKASSFIATSQTAGFLLFKKYRRTRNFKSYGTLNWIKIF